MVYCCPAVVVNTSQLPPLGVVTVAATVKAVTLWPCGLATEIYCGETLAPGAVAVKVSEGDVEVPPLAVTETEVPLVDAPTTKVTVTDCVTPFTTNETLPE